MKRIDYTTKDYHGYREGMIEQIPMKMPEWTDRSPNDVGIVILELLAYELDKLSYYNDRVANETFLSTATQRKSVIDRCKLIGYELEWQTSAKHFQVFEFVPQVEDTVIPEGSLVGTQGDAVEEAVYFETMEDLIIPAGKTGLEKDDDGRYLYMVEVEHGQTVEDELIGSVEDDTPFQEFDIQYSPILKNSISVFVEEQNGRREWERVQDFIGSTRDSEHYKAEMNEYDIVKIQFGSGFTGKVPEAPASITATYKVGGGDEGNVGAEAINQLYISVPGLVATFNPYGPHVLGREKESIDEAKWKGPASLKRLERYVTLDDYETGVRLDFPEVAKTKAINVNGDVDLYVVPFEGDKVTADLSSKIRREIEEKKVLFTKVFVKDPVYMDFDIKVNLIMYDNYDPEMLKYSAEYILREMYLPENVEFGEQIKVAEMHHELFKIQGVRNSIIINPVGDLEPVETSIPRLKNVEVLVNGL